MIIDPKQLTEEALDGVLESYIHRDGTDYGELELSLSQKVANLKRQITSKEAYILYDSVNDEINIVSKQEMDRHKL